MDFEENGLLFMRLRTLSAANHKGPSHSRYCKLSPVCLRLGLLDTLAPERKNSLKKASRPGAYRPDISGCGRPDTVKFCTPTDIDRNRFAEDFNTTLLLGWSGGNSRFCSLASLPKAQMSE